MGKAEMCIRDSAKHEFGMYLNGRWYSATAKPGTFPAGHPIESLDCAILQTNVLAPRLNSPETGELRPKDISSASVRCV